MGDKSDMKATMSLVLHQWIMGSLILVFTLIAVGDLRAQVVDCNNNGVADEMDIASGYSSDCNLNSIPDECESVTFRRGEVNGDQIVDVADAISTVSYLFLGSTVECADAADSNDDGVLDIADAVFLLSALFSGGALPPEPGIDSCGVDPTADNLGCDQSCSC